MTDTAYIVCISEMGRLMGEVVTTLDWRTGPTLASLVDAGFDIGITVAGAAQFDPFDLEEGPLSPNRAAGERLLAEFSKGSTSYEA
jgi:hypothetical protein